MVDIGIREDGETLPLIIRPKAGADMGRNKSAAFLKEWVRANRQLVEQKLSEHGEWAWSFACGLL